MYKLRVRPGRAFMNRELYQRRLEFLAKVAEMNMSDLEARLRQLSMGYDIVS
ncbi:MAG TPA: hypothetical protein VMR98_01320 [Candidatus Polarisedimenticolaceae bacterium]|nr:hypothetical protein [Candidatus Polarisedimenticolaceae bacterium]